nr:hypothetical protein [uncultured Pedobacter sp.]
MRNFLKKTAIIIIVSITNTAYSSTLLQSYNIHPSDLVNGKINVSSNPKSFTALFTLTRGIKPTTGGYEDVNAKVRVFVVSPTHFDPLIISDVKTITTSNFSGDYYYDGSIQCSLPSSYSDGKVYIEYSYEYSPGYFTSYSSSVNYFNTQITNWITDLDNSIRYNDYGCTIKWNSQLVTTNTVTFEVYQFGVLKGTIVSGTPNDGEQYMDWTTLATTGGNPYGGPIETGVGDPHWWYDVQLKIISDSNPNISSITPKFKMQYD